MLFTDILASLVLELASIAMQISASIFAETISFRDKIDSIACRTLSKLKFFFTFLP